MNQIKINTIIVDDNKELCNILNEYLSMQGDIVVTGIANDGLEALKLIQEKKPNLVILDMIMPRLDGLGVLEVLSNMNLSVVPKIIVFSAVGQDKLTKRAITLGIDYYITKPFNLDIFVKRIRQMFNDDNSNDKLIKPVTFMNDLKEKLNNNEVYLKETARIFA